jgi:hypothetical protein
MKIGNEKDDAARVAFLFEKYQELVTLLMETEPIKKRRKTRTENSLYKIQLNI